MDPERRREVVTWMKEHMAASGIHARDVGKRLGHDTNSFVSQVLRRDKKIPLEQAEKWARALKLDDRDVPHFRLLVDLMWSAESIRMAYWSMRDRIASMEDRTESHAEQVTAQAARIAALEAQLALSEKEKAALKRRA